MRKAMLTHNIQALALNCMACRCQYLTQTLGDAGVVRDAVKGQASPRQSHDIETWCSTPVQHQLCILIVELLAILCCCDELHRMHIS